MKDLIETHTQVFIVKVWLEETKEEAGRVTWRGHITHIPSRKRHYIKKLDDIALFMAPYLLNVGIKISPILHVRLLLRKWLGY